MSFAAALALDHWVAAQTSRVLGLWVLSRAMCSLPNFHSIHRSWCQMGQTGQMVQVCSNQFSLSLFCFLMTSPPTTPATMTTAAHPQPKTCSFKCPIGGSKSCQRGFRSLSRLTQHCNALHASIAVDQHRHPQCVTVDDVDTDEDSDSKGDQAH